MRLIFSLPKDTSVLNQYFKLKVAYFPFYFIVTPKKSRLWRTDYSRVFQFYMRKCIKAAKHISESCHKYLRNPKGLAED